VTTSAEAAEQSTNTPAGGTPLLTVDNLRVSFGDSEVVKGISLAAWPGRCLAIVGESGSGKSVTARTLVGLTGPNSRVRADRIEFAGHDLSRQSERSWRAIRGRDIGFILQDALVSLDQLRRVGDEITEPLKLHGWGTRAARGERAVELLASVGVPEPAVRVRQRPYELSGGLRQRSPRPSRSTRSWSWPTSRPPRSTSPSRRRCSTCWPSRRTAAGR
jgi:peptide/nickel transport system ATP-binding protein